MPAASARGLRRVERGRDDRHQVDAAQVEGELTRLDLRREEQVADELQQAAGVALGDAEELQLLVGERMLRVVAEQLDVSEDRAQRRAQLVRDHPDELVLHAGDLDRPGLVDGDEQVADGCRRPRRGGW